MAVSPKDYDCPVCGAQIGESCIRLVQDATHAVRPRTAKDLPARATAQFPHRSRVALAEDWERPGVDVETMIAAADERRRAAQETTATIPNRPKEG